MALIKCKECGKEISDTAKVCINCGAKINHKKSNYKDIFIATTILLFLIIALIVCYITTNYSQSAHKYSKEAINILRDYKDNKIGNTKAISELKSLSYKAKEEYEEKDDDVKLSLISVELSNIATSMEIETLDRLDIEDFIKELKEF